MLRDLIYICSLLGYILQNQHQKNVLVLRKMRSFIGEHFLVKMINFTLCVSKEIVELARLKSSKYGHVGQPKCSIYYISGHRYRKKLTGALEATGSIVLLFITSLTGLARMPRRRYNFNFNLICSMMNSRYCVL